MSDLQHYALPLAPSDGTIYIHSEEIAPETTFQSHRHPWGQLNMVDSGVVELTVAGEVFLSPPQYAIWIPADIEHTSYSRQRVAYRAVYVNQDWARTLPDAPCMLMVSPLVRAIMADFAGREVDIPKTPADRRLARVLVDQLALAEPLAAYLPSTSDPMLTPILEALQADPANNDTLAQWARRRHTTERTLARRCQRELRMSFSDWRSRLRFLTSLGMLKKGLSVKEVALELGYSSSSAFITLFRRHAGTSPEQYRRTRGLKEGRALE
ncbi:transcriptional regulator, AraC family [Ferrimonas balearica DSM 9799]|uniref:Transcriptional regulator, AraC family n=1 Tax=Ferrimonas balearica (strain DSM 9799 / CCM 4581 / KCTC 23876 / PAT) TaxID=550540 RepID=E1SPY2_FERBD|nr:helix-turn-helix transcriptional regulator [Ferrimonas balearica]ADN75777.1 transcriptional regulator, AraC family [Ferrimonas balearica DSM 9799]MBW3138680.1 helix-turn-helix transcriptional regulator [Ferrimonas balearica]MBW3163719.1 helix-turn-helix transcriptional regulator [Ferrimonas balearica]MBY5979473.1 helix-turn-helix transcriptional regulator [Ferrimonas balearica]MBY6105741.1 helix-turn-helix transcriptional regulator [Ferrimonas balearica]